MTLSQLEWSYKFVALVSQLFENKKLHFILNIVKYQITILVLYTQIVPMAARFTWYLWYH